MDFFFVLSKIFWFVASPDSFLILLSVVSVLLIYSKSVWGTRLLTLNVLLYLLLLFFPVGDLLLHPLESRFSAPKTKLTDVEGVIVLGGSERADVASKWEQAQFNSAGERMMALPVLARAYPQARLIFSGGSGSVLYPQDIAQVQLNQWFRSQGLEYSVIWEKRSRNTFENALYSQALLGGPPKGRWILVTSASHMPRSVGVFRAQGWDVIPYPVDYNSKSVTGLRFEPSYWRHVRDLSSAVKEWIGLTVYYLTGKTQQFFPGPPDLIGQNIE